MYESLGVSLLFHNNRHYTYTIKACTPLVSKCESLIFCAINGTDVKHSLRCTKEEGKRTSRGKRTTLSSNIASAIIRLADPLLYSEEYIQNVKGEIFLILL